MQPIYTLLSLLPVAARRLWNHRLLMGCLLAGLLAAVSLLASIPLYADAVQNRLLQGELTEAGTHRPPLRFSLALRGGLAWRRQLGAVWPY